MTRQRPGKSGPSQALQKRTVTRILRDQETKGYIRTQREGRLNLYGVNNLAPLRRQDARDVAVDELLRVLHNDG